MVKKTTKTIITTSKITAESWTILFDIIMGPLYLKSFSRKHPGLEKSSYGANPIEPVD
jgi:hypothetical protein